MTMPDFPSFDDIGGEAVPADAGTNSAVEALLTEDVGPSPDIAVPHSDGFIKLPGGLIKEGEVIRDAEVVELTGEAEEALAKVRENPAKFMSVLLRYGVQTIGGEKATPQSLKELLIGDRDTLLLGIRGVTFGSDIELPEFTCPGCGAKLDIAIDLSTIPIRTVDEREFNVELHHGVTAKVRLPNGHDQEALFEDTTLNVPEQNTLMLTRCVKSLTSPDGQVKKVSMTVIKGLGIADRKLLIKAIDDTTPGPQFDDVKFRHDECDTEVPVGVTIGDLFRNLF